MKKDELIIYELPSWAELCSIGWVQSLIAFWYARKVNRKFIRYQKRLARAKFFSDLLSKGRE